MQKDLDSYQQIPLPAFGSVERACYVFEANYKKGLYGSIQTNEWFH